jgi:hypothetical protein
MRKRNSSTRRYRHHVKVLKSEVISPRIAWFSFLGFLKTLTKIALALAILLGITYGIRQAIEHTFHRNPDFRLQVINLNTNDVLDESALVEHLNINLDGNIFDFDIDSMESKLLEIPAIKTAKIERELPGTLTFKVTTRIPFAWVSHTNNNPADRLLVDQEGYVYPCPPLQLQSASLLPTIVLINNSEHPITSGKIITHPDYKYGARLLKSYLTTFPDDISLIDSITRNNEWSLNLITRSGTIATFGLAEHPRQLEAFATALNHAQHRGYEIATINLIPKRNIPITLSSEAPPPRAIPVSEEMLSETEEYENNQDLRSLLNRN